VGFDEIPCFNCAYGYKDKAILVIYVDDIFLFCENAEIKQEIITRIQANFEIVDQGPIQTALGVNFQRKKGNVVINQTKYTENVTASETKSQ
jgi:hypothetical protein